jgi:hypothetical protein
VVSGARAFGSKSGLPDLDIGSSQNKTGTRETRGRRKTVY